jgi:hypothetical protein
MIKPKTSPRSNHRNIVTESRREGVKVESTENYTAPNVPICKTT